MAVLNYTECQQIGILCEYIYRKGRYDASTLADRGEIENFSERDQEYDNFILVNDFTGAELSRHQYMDYVQMTLGRIGARALRNFFAYQKASSSPKMNICMVSEYYYRKGMREWSGESTARARDFLEKFGTGKRHERGKIKMTHEEFMDEVKYAISSIHFDRIEAGKKSSIRGLAINIADTTLGYRMSIL